MENIPASKRTTSPWLVNPMIQEAVDKRIREDPTSHRLAQGYGDWLLSHPLLGQVDTFHINNTNDVMGEEIKFQELQKTMMTHGYRPIDMDDDEIQLLIAKLGKNWKDELKKDYAFEDTDFPHDK